MGVKKNVEIDTVTLTDMG